MNLTFPTAEHKTAALDFRQEFFNHGEERFDGSAMLFDAPSYAFWLEAIQAAQTRVHERYVPSSTYFAIDNEKIIGIVDIRHYLNDYLINEGGHIGYSVRPTERRKGYATKILHLALQKCQELNIEKALVTCNSDNTASEKVIIKNGGIKENEFLEDNGTIVYRYWIDIKGHE